MKDTKLLPDDPKLTAYALGELSGDERAAVEACLRENPALRAVVEEVRATAKYLEAALGAEETAPEVPEVTTVTVHLNGRAMAAGSADDSVTTASRDRAQPPAGERDEYRSRERKLIRFPQFYFVCGGAAAACFAVMVALYRDAHDAKQQARIAQLRQLEAERIAAQPRTIVIPPRAFTSLETGTRTPGAPAAETGVAITIQAVPAPATAPAAEPAALAAQPRIGDPSAAAAEVVAVAETPRPAFVDKPLTLAERDATAPVARDNSTGPATLTPNAVVATSAPSGEPGPQNQPGVVVHTAPSGAAIPASTRDAVTALAPSRAVANETRAPLEVIPLRPLVVFAPRRSGASEEGDVPPIHASPPFAQNTEAYASTPENDFVGAAANKFSTFSIDVDTASYSNIRRIIEYGTLPPRDAVRVEELLNYFPYSYPPPPPNRGDGAPFAASLEVAEAPWAPQHRLVRIGLKAREVAMADRAAANLVFLIDVSGSMSAANKLPLVQESMRLLLGKLREDDRVAIVTYAGNSGLALPSTPVARRREILRALDALSAGGSTNGSMGIELAYDIAKAHFAKDGVNRVILCTDGDFNVGATSGEELVRLIEDKARSGVFLTVLGFGMGNLKDATLENLADKGNGHYGYIDSRREAQKLLVDQVSSTLVTVAKDVKIQVEFNPEKVARYRLIGYENRVLKKEDFNNDNVDAGEIGAGHTVTALYEIVPVGADEKFAALSRPVDDVKYQARGAVSSRLEMPSGPAKRPAADDKLLTVKLRYKKPDALFANQRVEFALKDTGLQFAKASADFRFAAAVAQFGMILRGSPHKGSATIGDVIAWAATAAASPSDDPGGYRGEFIDLVRKAQRMVQ